MAKAYSSQPRPGAGVLTQRALVGLALQDGARRLTDGPAAVPHSQRDRVRQALALGLGSRATDASRAARRGAYR